MSNIKFFNLKIVLLMDGIEILENDQKVELLLQIATVAVMHVIFLYSVNQTWPK